MRQNQNPMNSKGPFRLRCEHEMLVLIEKIAISKGLTKSEVVRQLIHKGLQERKVQEDPAAYQDELQKRIQAMVQTAMQPYMERLAAMSAKSAQIAAASFFMTAYTQGAQFPGLMPDAAVKAHRLGMVYLNIKGDDLEEYIKGLF